MMMIQLNSLIQRESCFIELKGGSTGTGYNPFFDLTLVLKGTQDSETTKNALYSRRTCDEFGLGFRV